MSLRVKGRFNIDRELLLSRRGLGKGNEVRRYIAENVRGRCDRRVPMDTGFLKNSAVISEDGRTITYTAPYARYQYMGISEKGAPLSYNGAPMRGSYWVQRMAADEAPDITADTERFIRGFGK